MSEYENTESGHRDKPLFTTKEAAEFLGISPQSLAFYRHRRRNGMNNAGPDYVKSDKGQSGGYVFYRYEDLLKHQAKTAKSGS